VTRATILFSLLAVALAIVASAADMDGAAETATWLAALAVGTLALLAAYGVAITWARRRKRLWG
jgi:ABC-type transport system involved in cytochrome c biogenesis permease component